jgi:hypothetical protein
MAGCDLVARARVVTVDLDLDLAVAVAVAVGTVVGRAGVADPGRGLLVRPPSSCGPVI